VARIRERKNAPSVLVGNPEGKRHFENLDIEGRITLK
jgi:hypothetical protein